MGEGGYGGPGGEPKWVHDVEFPKESIKKLCFKKKKKNIFIPDQYIIILILVILLDVKWYLIEGFFFHFSDG